MSPTEKKMRSLLGELKELGAHQTETLFACGGSIELDQAIRLHYSSCEGSELQEGTVVFPPRDSEKSLSALIEACDPAGFGRGHELVMDKEYRSASEMPADRMLTSFSLPETAIMSEIQSLLAPNASVVRARLYKLNVYETGGLFKAHVDTPRGSNMFGTLVVCMPTSFTGGDFVVEHKGQKQTFAWSHANPPSEAKDGAQQASPATLQWCAFYSDCQHEVLQVTSGYRVTLTYLLENDESGSGTTLDGIRNNPFVVKLDELIKESKLDKGGRVFGFALEHKYVVDGTGTVPMLKGFDRFVQSVLDALKLKYRFAPVFLASRDGEEGCRERSYELLPDRMLDRPSVSIDDTEAYVGNWRTLVAGAGDCYYGDFYGKESIGAFEESVLDASEEEVQWIVPPTSMQYMLHSIQYGNEPLGYEYYATAAFLVSV